MKLISMGFVLFLLISKSVFAEELPLEMYTPTEGGEFITITTKDCPNDSLKKEYLHYAYVMDKEGTLHEGCWNRFEPPRNDMTPLVVIRFFTDNVSMSIGQYYFSPTKTFNGKTSN